MRRSANASAASDEQERGRDDPAQALDQEHLQQQPGRDQHHRLPVQLEAALVRNVPEGGLPEHRSPDQEKPYGDQEGKQARADRDVGRRHLQHGGLDGDERAQPEHHPAQHRLANAQTPPRRHRQTLSIGGFVKQIGRSRMGSRPDQAIGRARSP